MIHEQPGGPEQAFDGTVIFPPDDGPEILYPVDGFGMNLARGMAMTWIKLGFLAALGLLAGTFLGFPVACLLALAVFVLAAASGTLLESLEYFGENTQQQAMKAVAVALREVLGVLATLLKQFSRFAPHGDIVTGRLVPWSDVTACAGWIGLLWTGLTGLSAWLVFRARELAKGTS
ncbi:MAG: hypothetical protein M5U26_09010 [Planctomycetota bacterium]|nr:hypothetical protein [Planctomycetota bacterium]